MQLLAATLLNLRACRTKAKETEPEVAEKTAGAAQAEAQAEAAGAAEGAEVKR